MKTRTAKPAPGERTARCLTWLYAGAVIVNIALLIGTPLRGGFSFIEFAAYVLNLPVERSLIATVASIVIFWALMRRKRAGLWAALFFQVAGSALALVSTISLPWTLEEEPPSGLWVAIGANAISVIIGVVLTVLLVRARRAFPARTLRSSYGMALAVLGLSLIHI